MMGENEKPPHLLHQPMQQQHMQHMQHLGLGPGKKNVNVL
jgi:hypothetical protein